MNALSKLTESKTIIIVTHRPDLVKGRKEIIDLNSLGATQTSSAHAQ
jgi:ABC-type bacteriocin/lantibiotic exporter with double-glycine peptidase domain